MDVGVHSVAVDPRSEWQLASAMACIAGVGTLVFLLVDLRGVGVRPVELIVRIVHLLIFAGVGVWLWARRRRPTRRLATIAALTMWAPYFVTLWLSEETAALAGHPWGPFVGHKMLFIGTAVIIPGSPWFGAAMLLALGLHALALWFYLDLGTASADLPLDEPWATVGYLCVAGVLYGVRIHQGRVEHELARVRAEAKSLEVSTEVLIVLHDLMNTPLQVLELAIALLRQRRLGDDPVINAAVHALARLQVLRDQLPVSTATRASLDPEVLRRLQAAVASHDAARRSGDESRGE
jgi:hypothetical protein